MSPQEINALHIIHVFSVIGLGGTVFYACAGAPETKKSVAMWSGILSLIVGLTGLRMWQGMYQFHGGWAVVKIVCWIGLSAFVGLAYRKREKSGLWIALTLILALIAVTMVYLKPF